MKVSYDNSAPAGINTLMTVGDDEIPITYPVQTAPDVISPLACGVKNGLMSGLMVYGLMRLLNLEYARAGGLTMGVFEIVWALRDKS